MANELDFTNRLLVNRNCFGLNIHRAGRVVAKKFDDAFRDIGINHWQFAFLLTVSVPNGMGVKELARSLVVDRTTITANMKPLERAGLISVRVDDEDARSRRIEITDKGTEVLRTAYPTWKKINDEISGIVTVQEREEVLGVLSAITNLDA